MAKAKTMEPRTERVRASWTGVRGTASTATSGLVMRPLPLSCVNQPEHGYVLEHLIGHCLRRQAGGGHGDVCRAVMRQAAVGAGFSSFRRSQQGTHFPFHGAAGQQFGEWSFKKDRAVFGWMDQQRTGGLVLDRAAAERQHDLLLV